MGRGKSSHGADRGGKQANKGLKKPRNTKNGPTQELNSTFYRSKKCQIRPVLFIGIPYTYLID